jgi:hypothetical protein
VIQTACRIELRRSPWTVVTRRFPANIYNGILCTETFTLNSKRGLFVKDDQAATRRDACGSRWYLRLINVSEVCAGDPAPTVNVMEAETMWNRGS